MKPELAIIKIGGNVIENPEDLTRFLTLFSRLKAPKILVHGGGRHATHLATKLGVETQMVAGRRITDAASLEVALMVYAGLVNKQIVGQLQGMRCNALGLSGADANLIQAHKRPVGDVDFGWVGDIDDINSGTLTGLINLGLVPVFCAITHDRQGQMFNTNADTIATELAIALGKQYRISLYFCFEKKGVLYEKDNDLSVIPHINMDTYQKLFEEKIIADGMLPKMENCFRALQNGVARVCIGKMDMLGSDPGRFTTLSL